jgi:hypothetical protein
MAPRNVGINSTFDQQRVVINEIAVDVDNLLNAGYATTSYVGTVTLGLASVSYVDNKVAISTSGLASVSYVDNKVAISTSGLLTPTSSGSSLTGIVTSITAGSGISINQSTGNVTITSLGGGGGENLDQTLGTGNTSSKGMSVGVVTATSFVKSGGTSSQFLKADGSVDSNSYLTSTSSGSSLTGIVTSITAGSGISINQSTGNVTITATGGGGGGESYWVSTAVGIHTLSNVGIGTTNATSKLTVQGDVSVSGVSTFTNGPILIGSGTSTGTSSQPLQVTGGAYVSGNIGLGTTNPTTKLQINGILGFGADNNARIGDSNTGSSITNGTNNIFIGSNAGRFNNTGSSNVFLGLNAGYSNQGGASNILIGNGAGYFNTGSSNVFFGLNTGFNNSSGSSNNFIGVAAGISNQTGSNNVFLGARNGISVSASYKVIIGSGNLANYFDSPDTTKSNQFAVGIRTDANPSKYWLVGDENFNVGIGTTNPTSKLTVQGNTSLETLSVSGISTLTTTLIGGVTSTGTSSQPLQVTGGAYVSGNIGVGVTNPSYKLDVTGAVRLGNSVAQGVPSISDISTNAHTLLSGQGGNYLSIGQYGPGNSYAQWIQSGFVIPSTATYNIVLQPLGGNLGIGATNPSTRLHVIGDSTVSGVTNLNQITETVVNAFNTALAPSTGTLTVDTSLGTVVLGDLNASVTTWAFTNVPTANSKAITVTLIIDGDTAQTYGDACNVNGSAVSGGVKWSGGSAPTATNNFDIITFTIVKDSAGTINVFGSGNTNFS